MKNIPPTDKVCWNCEHIIKAIGAGGGLRCKHPNNSKDDKSPLIRSSMHTCEYFETKE